MLTLLPEGCGLYIHVKSVQGFDNKDGEGAADFFITVNAAAQKHQTRTVKKGQPLEWRDVCIFGEDILLQGGRSINFEACSKGRWSSNVVVASGMLRLEQVQEPGAVTAASVPLRLPDKPSILWGTLLLELSAVHSASTLPGVLERLATKAPSGSAAAASAAVALSPEVTVIPPGAPPRVLHCAAGAVYEEPCMLFLRVTLHSASGLRNTTLDSPRTSSRNLKSERPQASAASQLASAFITKSRADISTFFGLRRRKPDASTDSPPSATTLLDAPTSATPLPDAAPLLAPTPRTDSASEPQTPPAPGPSATKQLISPFAGNSSPPADPPTLATAADPPLVKPAVGKSPRAAAATSAVANALNLWKAKPSTAPPVKAAKPAAAVPDQVLASQAPPGAALPSALAAAAALMVGAATPPVAPAAVTAAPVATEAARDASPTGSGGADLAARDSMDGGSSSERADRRAESAEGSWDEGSRDEGSRWSGGGQEPDEISAKCVIAALEENGFHVTDAPGGTHFYFKAGYEGQSWVSTMAQQGGGVATWGQSFLLATQRPLPALPLLELDLLVSTDVKTRGRQACKFRIPLPSLQPTPLGTPPNVQTFRTSMDETYPCEVQLSAELVDADPRAADLPLPLSAPVLDPLESTSSPLSPPPPAPPSAPAPPAPQADGPSSPPSQPTTPTSGASARPLPLPLTPTTPTASFTSSQPPTFQLHPPDPPAAQPARPPGALLPSSPPPLAVLHLMISSFELVDKPCDCFFVVKFGNFWCQSIPLSTPLQPKWDWELRLPIIDPSDLITIGLFRAADNNAAQKVVQATRSIVFTDTTRSIGRLRIRPTTLLPGKLCCRRLPMHADRTAAKGGVTTAHVSLAMRVQYGSTAGCLLQYWQPPVYWPCILLMDKLGVEAEALKQARQKVAFRWLEDCAPPIPSRTARRMTDDGRQEFTLSRTNQNWRRVTAVADVLQPLSEWFDIICTWSNPLLSGSVALGLVLLAVYPSKVVALGMAALVLHLCTTAYWGACAHERFGMPLQMVDDLQVKADEGEVVAAPMDPYTALKQNYDALVAFSMKVQNVLDSLASKVEALASLLSWHDPVATLQFIVLLSITALLSWAMGMRFIVCAALMWTVRPPFLRDPYPPPPINFLDRLPLRSDTML